MPHSKPTSETGEVLSSFHKFLLKKRIYCQMGLCMNLGTRVIQHCGRDTVVCDLCYGKPEPNPIETSGFPTDSNGTTKI